MLSQAVSCLRLGSTSVTADDIHIIAAIPEWQALYSLLLRNLHYRTGALLQWSLDDPSCVSPGYHGEPACNRCASSLQRVAESPIVQASDGQTGVQLVEDCESASSASKPRMVLAEEMKKRLIKSTS
ncbi:hypothetical protein FKP32DRAFT_1317129 [Trametes sanguinea]|nr:hypothetical protein FKP32DRAFT_1317129 [Trametes sanguinea]